MRTVRNDRYSAKFFLYFVDFFPPDHNRCVFRVCLEHPFVNEITIEPEALRRMLDSILSALLPSVQPGVLKLVSKLTVQNYILSLEINGTVNELRIPLHNEF